MHLNTSLVHVELTLHTADIDQLARRDEADACG
jgi:hypothetical protein